MAAGMLFLYRVEKNYSGDGSDWEPDWIFLENLVGAKEKTMNQELSFKTAICTEYDRLLHECHRALEIWRRRREEAIEAHLSGKEIGDELQRLQANYAKSYSVLKRHGKECELCRFVSKFGGRERVDEAGQRWNNGRMN